MHVLDPEQSEALEELVQILLNDTSTMVLGSAVAAFTEVCPDKWELIHPNFRKIVRLCADTDEAQIANSPLNTGLIGSKFIGH